MKLRVLHLSAATGLGGAERVLLNFLSCHDAERFAISVAAYVNHKKQDNSFTEEVDRLRVPFTKIPLSNFTQGHVLRETIRLVRSGAFDLVHSHGYRSDVIGFLAARRVGVPILSTVHGWTPTSLKLRCYEGLDRWFLRRFDAVIGVSKGITDSLVDNGCNPERVYLLHNAVPPLDSPSGRQDDADCSDAALLADCGARLILFVGRLSPEKGIDILLHAFKLHCGNHNVRLLMVGDGPLRHELERLAASLSLSDRVHFLGFSKNVEQYYKISDFFVLPSRSEGLPMVMLEAMRAGLPVICTRVGAIPQVIQDGINGVIVPAEDINALGAAMNAFISNPDNAAALGERGRVTVSEQFSADTWARSIEQIYLRTIRNFSAGH